MYDGCYSLLESELEANKKRIISGRGLEEVKDVLY